MDMRYFGGQFLYEPGTAPGMGQFRVMAPAMAAFSGLHDGPRLWHGVWVSNRAAHQSGIGSRKTVDVVMCPAGTTA